MSHTPRTDAEHSRIGDWPNKADCYATMELHARQLERELAVMTRAKNKALRALKQELEWYQESGFDRVYPGDVEPRMNSLRRLIAELEKVK